MRQTFEEVVVKRVVRGKCPGCGKTKSRTLRDSATVNPFNRTEQDPKARVVADVDMTKGRPKTLDEVRAEVTARVAAMAARPFACAACEADGSAPVMTGR